MESVIVFGIFRHLLFNGSLFLYERLSAGFGDALYPIVAKGVFLKRWAINFAEKKQETLQRIDDQIAELHGKHRVTFYTSSVAKSDGANMLKLDLLEGLLTKLVRIRQVL